MATDPRISAATNVTELLSAINAIYDECDQTGDDPDDIFDDLDLPKFGGDPLLPTEGLFSWDEENVLMGDTITDAAVVTRAEWRAAMDLD